MLEIENLTAEGFTPDWKEDVSMGTTLVAMEIDGGVVVATDSRTSVGTMVENRVSDKITRVTDRIFCCRSGSAADTQAVANIVSYHLEFHEIELGEPAEVKLAANVFRDICYNYRDQLKAGIIVAGWDKKNGGQVYSVPLGGMIMKQKVALGGSGSTFLYGYFDANYKDNMSKEQAAEFLLKAVSCAANRDGSSGGLVRMAIITEAGVERRVYTEDKFPKLQDF